MRKIIVFLLFALLSYQAVQSMKDDPSVTVGPSMMVDPLLETYKVKTLTVGDVLAAGAVPFLIEAALIVAGTTAFGVGLAKSMQSKKKLHLLKRINKHLLNDAKVLRDQEILKIAMEEERFTAKELKTLQKIIDNEASEESVRRWKGFWNILCVLGATVSIGSLCSAAITYFLTFYTQKKLIEGPLMKRWKDVE